MATTTHTASTALVGPYLIHAGVNSVTGRYVAPATTTIGDTILIARIPSGVDIIGVYGKITTAATAANATVGISGANTQFGSLASGTAPAWADEGATKFRVSLSDDAQPQYTFITVAPSSATWTVTATVDLTVLYTHK